MKKKGIKEWPNFLVIYKRNHEPSEIHNNGLKDNLVWESCLTKWSKDFKESQKNTSRKNCKPLLGFSEFPKDLRGLKVSTVEKFVVIHIKEFLEFFNRSRQACKPIFGHSFICPTESPEQIKVFTENSIFSYGRTSTVTLFLVFL